MSILLYFFQLASFDSMVFMTYRFILILIFIEFQNNCYCDCCLGQGRGGVCCLLCFYLSLRDNIIMNETNIIMFECFFVFSYFVTVFYLYLYAWNTSKCLHSSLSVLGLTKIVLGLGKECHISVSLLTGTMLYFSSNILIIFCYAFVYSLSKWNSYYFLKVRWCIKVCWLKVIR